MDKTILYSIIGGLVGVIIGIFFAGNAVNTSNSRMMNMMGIRSFQDENFGCSMGDISEREGMNMGMNEMTESLRNLRDKEFDKEFIEKMMDHHQGAIEMAELVSTRTERQELRTLADQITAAQSEEIDMMQGWMKEWFSE